jgi:hypothetical protein
MSGPKRFVSRQVRVAPAREKVTADKVAVCFEGIPMPMRQALEQMLNDNKLKGWSKVMDGTTRRKVSLSQQLRQELKKMQVQSIKTEFEVMYDLQECTLSTEVASVGTVPGGSSLRSKVKGAVEKELMQVCHGMEQEFQEHCIRSIMESMGPAQFEYAPPDAAGVSTFRLAASQIPQ